MENNKRIYTGQVKSKKRGLTVISFEFEKKLPEYTLVENPPEILEGCIITFTLEPEGQKAFFLALITNPGTAMADLYKIVEQNRLSLTFPEAVLAETWRIQENPGIDDPALTDLTALPFVTIDNEESRDLDQALYIERTAQGYRVMYALADGGYYIRPGSALFAEALKRGSSYYLPGLSVPMLPPELSEGILSLNPQVDRRAFTFIMDLDEAGRSMASRCLQTRIHSKAKLSYNGVQAYYDDPASSPLSGREFSEVLDLLKVVGELRLKAASLTNQVHFNRKEAEISCTADGSAFRIAMEDRNDCSLYNEQISLLCNMEGARFLVAAKEPEVQGIYRVHQSPEPEVLRELAETLAQILKIQGIREEAWNWHPEKEILADYVDRLHALPARTRLKDALERQILLTMRRSLYTDTAGEHFALGTNPYSRFSSPMREIVGIFIHKEALEKLGALPPRPRTADGELRAQVIEAGNRAKEKQRTLERALVEVAANRLFGRELKRDKKARTRYTATILGVKQTRLYVRLDSPPLELKVYTEDLEAFTHQPLELKHSALCNKSTGELLYRPGDEISLYVEAYRQERWRLVPGS